MNKTELSKYIELYSNAIVGFIVLQGLLFCYTFGTNDKFNLILKRETLLSSGLAVLFLVTWILALFANNFLGRKLQTLSGEYAQLVKVLYFGKAVTIAIFGALPAIIVMRYAIYNPVVP